MPQIKEQKQRIEDIATARYITGTLRDIATIELQALQKQFSLNTTVYTELRDLYQLVWRIAVQEGRAKSKKRSKRLYVAYTTNRHFYGALNDNIMRTFTDATSSKDECLIIGTTGKTFWMNSPKKRKNVSFMAFEDDVPTKEEVQAFLARTGTYDQVLICYPAFINTFQQEARITDISFLPDQQTSSGITNDPGPQFLLEPDVDQMLTFFNTQVRYALFERILLETQLSRVSARVVKMDTADQNAEALLKRERHGLRRSFIMASGRRMLETLVGFIQWHKNVQPTVR